jgi:hypothetical protein
VKSRMISLDRGTSASGESSTKYCHPADRSSALGLATLFAMPDPSLRSIMVRGDLVINEDNRDSMSTLNAREES